VSQETKKQKEEERPALSVQQLADRGITLTTMNQSLHRQQMINVVSLQIEAYAQLLKSLLNLN
jgi:hypothetical protein